MANQKRFCAATLGLIFLASGTAALAQFTHAQADVFIQVAGRQKHDPHSGDLEASASAEDSDPAGPNDLPASAQARASVTAQFMTAASVKLRTYAKAMNAQAQAGCNWIDHLKFSDDSVLLESFLSQKPFFYFRNRVGGKLDGVPFATRWELGVRLYNAADGRFTMSFIGATGPDVASRILDLAIPANFFGPFPPGVEPSTYELLLNVESGRIDPETHEYIGDGTADFEHTGELLDYYIADSGGNPVSGSDNVWIKGDFGKYTKIDPPAKLQNISTRMQVRTGNDLLIGGFIVAGTQPKKVIVRGLGPSLPITGALADPTLELHDATSTLATNDNWKDSQQSEIEGTGIPPGNEKESAIVRTLPANNASYTAILAGKNNTTGIGLVEIYDIGSLADSRLANISTRGFVDTGDNVMIGGLILGPTGTSAIKVLVRGLGPSLTAAGVTGALPDPILELHDGNGATLATNDNWQESQAQEISDTTIPPTNPLESAIVRTVPNGNFTAILRGKDNAAGVGLVEIYRLP